MADQGCPGLNLECQCTTKCQCKPEHCEGCPEAQGDRLSEDRNALLWVAAIVLRPLVCEFDPMDDNTGDYIATVFDVKAVCLALGLYDCPPLGRTPPRNVLP